MTYISHSSDETIKIGEQLGQKLKSDSAVLLYGAMGAGKTHFVKGIALGLGIAENVTSPTFSIVNEYENRLFHFDLFRVTGSDDLYATGFFDYIKRGIIVCEWSENIPELENEFGNYYKVHIVGRDTTGAPDEREINVDFRT
jgi:tRNA threonylcarbamoyladenosine biosynthesis protein TsaE